MAVLKVSRTGLPPASRAVASFNQDTHELTTPVSIASTSTVNAADWDELAARMNGGVFHCCAHTLWEARVSDSEPLFMKAITADGRCIGIAAGTLKVSRYWPFSRYCRLAEFSSLPVVGSADAAVARAVLRSIEDHLSRRGVHEIRFASYDSPLACEVLPHLEYQTYARNEYFFDLTQGIDDLWKAINRARKRGVHKAEKSGIVTRPENTITALELVDRLHDMSMERRGIAPRAITARRRAANEKLLTSGLLHIFVSFKDDAPVNAIKFALFNSRVFGLAGGSTELGNKCYGPVHLIWTAIECFKRNGATQLNLGGAKEHEDGLRAFKREFGAIERPEPTGTKSISRIGSMLAASRRIVSRR